MAKVERFEDLNTWQKARELNRDIYSVSKGRTFSRDYAFCSQIRRASVSVMSNIAEGFERGGDKEFVQFLSVAKGSCGEVRSQIYVALDQEYITQEKFDAIREKALEVSRLLSGFMRYLQGAPLRGNKYK